MSRERSRERDALIGRIRALMALTEENGASEAEAMSAAAKASELMARYGLGADAVDLGAADCAQVECEGGGSDLDRIASAVAAFAEVRLWRSEAAGRPPRLTFFGLVEDVQMAGYVFAVCRRAIETETAREADHLSLLRREVREKRLRSFRDGMAHGISEALRRIGERRRADLRKSTGRDLVPVKAARVNEEFERLGLHLDSRRLVRRDAAPRDFERGRSAGEAVRIDPALGRGDREAGQRRLLGHGA